MVRWVSDPYGRFKDRPHYELDELDSECEQLIEEFLIDYRMHRGLVIYPITTNELCVLMDRETSDFDLYADFSNLAGDVQGETTFAPKGSPAVRISANLQEPHRENRLRTTITHELGHVKFHNYLYGLNPGKPSPCCTEATILGATNYDWMEWQAGYCSGSYLMPTRALKKAVREIKREGGITGTPEVADEQGQLLIREVAGRFQVSADAARVRLLQRNLLFE